MPHGPQECVAWSAPVLWSNGQIVWTLFPTRELAERACAEYEEDVLKYYEKHFGRKDCAS